MAELTFKQRQFVSYYLGVSNGNGADAVRRAGYATRWPDKIAAQLIGNTRVRAAIEARMSEVAISADEVLARLSDHATSSLGDFIRVDKTNRVTVDYRQAKKRGRLHCIKKLRKGKYGWELEMYDAQAALVQLGKYHGLFDRINLDDVQDEDLEKHAGGGAPGGNPQEKGGREEGG